MGDEVKFTDEQWERVATAAEDFAAVLQKEQAALRLVLSSNWAGACAEGEGTMQNLRDLLRGDSGSFAHAIAAEAQYLKDVAQQCRASKSVLMSIDDSISEQLK
ncbi:hypothetical protein [Nocardia sp. 348MFTsu5.1]|uniref:hypothetical protein n=1 Tax=Nocardia sp. 348MFTsu5.1 TaxID=1172185 RepID=UPI0012DC59D0|nr:hypothetical protein [Nocardia sp. 348MFTsu5.1]